MAESLYSKMEHAQYRGPTTSDNYNERIENYYKDLVMLLNRIGITQENIDRFYARMIKEQFSILQVIEELEARLDAIEADKNILTFYSTDQADVGRFDGTDFEITGPEECFLDSRHGITTLPKLEGSSISKLRFVNSDNTSVIPSTFEALADGIVGTADNSAATIDESDIYDAVLPEVGTVWERNVLVESPFVAGAQMDVFLRLPTDLAISGDTNAIIVHPFPMMGVDILDVSYTTAPQVFLNNNDTYTTVNNLALHDGEDDAVGWVPPGGWTGDEILNAGPKIFQFEPLPITGIKLRLRQNHYFFENNKYLYTYGLGNVDVRLDKFANTGRMIFKFDAPEGETISSVDEVTPQIWNVSPAELPFIFSHRVIWETSFDSGTYTTSPVAFSQRVWIEVTLNSTIRSAAPALSGLVVSYS